MEQCWIYRLQRQLPSKLSRGLVSKHSFTLINEQSVSELATFRF
jgi:hypothetical protein